jgi:hypothetical protein
MSTRGWPFVPTTRTEIVRVADVDHDHEPSTRDDFDVLEYRFTDPTREPLM